MKKLSQEEREKKVLENIGLVQYLAHKYKINGNVLDIDDLIQEGALGLMEAVDTFDEKRGAFVPYITMLITQYFTRGLESNEGIFSVGYKMYRLVSICRSFVMLKGRQPTNKEFIDISESIGVTYQNALRVYNGYMCCREGKKYLTIGNMAREDLDNTDYVSKGCTVEQYASDTGIRQQDAAERNEKLASIATMLRKCKKSERYVLALYYGLEGRKELLLREIAKRMGVSVSRVSNIKRAGEKRLKKLIK